MKKVILVLVVLSLLCVFLPVARAIETGTVKIFARDRDSGAAIPGAVITLNNRTKIAGNSGKRVWHLRKGWYNIGISAFKYLPYEGNVYVSRHKTTTAVVYLDKIIDSEELSGDLRIVLRDPSGQSISLALVIVDDGMSQTTNSLGEAIFTNLAFGNHTVRITKNGHLEIITIVNVGGGSNEVIYLTMSQDVTTSNGDLLVVVKNSSNSLLSGVLITIGSLSGYTDANGQVTFTGLAVNNYSLSAALSGYTTVNDIVSTASGDLVTFYVTMNPISSNTTSSLMVVARSSGSSLLSGVLVTVGSLSGYTDASGTVSFTNLAVGDYPLSAVLSGYININDIASTVSGESVTFYVMMFPN